MKFFNSDKSGFLSFVAKRMKALFALLFIIAGTSSVWGQNPELPWTYASEMSGWADAVGKSEYTFIRQDVVFAGNNYTHYLDIEFQSAGTDNYKLIEDGKNWYGMETTIPYQCKWWEWKSGAGNTAFQHNAGKYRFYINANSDQRKITVTGIFVTIDDEPVNNGDGTYTITGHYTNANPDQQIINSRQIVFTEGSGSGVGANENATDNGDGSFSFTTPKLTEGVQYTCNARIVDGAIGNHDSESVTFIAEAGQGTTKITPTEESYSVTWAEPVYDAEAGTVVLSATVAAAENAGFTLDQASGLKAQINVQYGASSGLVSLPNDDGQYVVSHTVTGVQSGSTVNYSLQIVTGGSNPLVGVSDVKNLNPQTYTVPESVEPEPVSLYLIGAGTSAQWVLADALPFTYENGVYTWTGNLTKNNEAFKILTSNKEWEPAYVAETDQFKVDLGEAIDLHYREKLGDNQYTCDDNKFKITEDDEYTIKVMLGADNSGSMIVTKKSDPVYAATITADASASQETAGQVALTSSLTETSASTDLATATCVFQYKAADAGDETYADMSEPASVIYSGEGATRTATLSQSMAAGDYVFRAVWTYNSDEVANAVTETVTIPSDTPTPTDIEFYVRGEKIGCTPSEGGNCWGVASEEFKATSKEGNVYVWNWISEPKLMVGPFKIADAFFTDENNYGLDKLTEISLSSEGTWTGTLQVNKASGDMEISEPGWNVSKITFDYDTKVLTIEAETSSSCQDFVDGFTISGRFNAGIEDADGLYQGRPISSKEADPANGYWSDGARFIQLTANNVPANYFDWECTTYAIDGVEKTIPDIAWTDKDKTSARAELSLPGTYTFVCKARCNETDEWTYSEELTITAPAPEMGFNGNIVTNHDWGTPSWAGQIDGGYMTRVEGSLVWKSNGFTVDGFGDDEKYQFVVEQRYKLLGCVTNEGWTENNECGESGESGKDNKINRSNLSFTNVAFNDNTPGYNFIAINNSGWTPGVNGTNLQLTVTMTGWDRYTVALEEVSQECTTPADNFAISAQLNKGAGAPFEGNLVASGSNTATRGYFADDFRTVTLTTTQVADTYEWKLVGYAIDGNAQATADLTTLATITNGEAQTATALLSLPGDYTFQCTAACTDGTPVNSATVTISTYPEMGFDGPIGTPANLTTENNGWNHAWAAEENNGLLERQSGTLTWTNTFTYQNVNNLTDFVVIQRYKLGCVATPKGYEDRPAYLGWAGHDECPGQSIVNSGNKINASANISFQGYAVSSNPGEQNMNFIASGEKVSSWISGETQLTLTVTMTDWDSYTVELAKKQEQIYAYYSSKDETMGTVTMKVGDTTIYNGDEITAYIGQQVTLTATPALGYKVASWDINGKVTESDRTTITPTLSGEDLNVVVTFERNCYSGVVYDLNGGGIICANGGSTELSLNTLNNVTYQLYKGDAKYGEAVQGNGEAAKWTISEAGTYTAKAYDSRFVDCKEQAIDMKGSAVVTTVTAPKITVNPGENVHLTVLQARSFTADVPVDWSITDAIGAGGYCEGDGYMISSQTDTSLVAKFLCIGTAKITATMKAPNENCMAEVTVHQNGAETEACAPEPEDMQ